MPQAVTITSLPSAFEYVKEMNMLSDTQWDGDYRSATRSALTRILHDRMAVSVDYHLAEMGRLDISDRRNGSYSRHLLTELGDIELHVPRTRRFSGLNVVKAYARRVSHVDQMILDGVVLSRKTGAGAVRRPVLVAMGKEMGVFSDKTRVERILFAVFIHENKNQGISAPFWSAIFQARR